MRPRPILSGPVFITRRVARREFRLQPSKATTRILVYLLAVLAERHEVLIHAVCVMSNHWHAVISDEKKRVAEFTRDFHSLAARHINAFYGDTEALWNGSQTSHVRPEMPQDLLGRIVYTMANPTAAGLVLYGHRWPGLRGAFGDASISVARPDGFLRDIQDEDGEDLWPEIATLTFARPPGFDELDDVELATRIKSQIEIAETEGRAKILASVRKSRAFLGAKEVLRQGRFDRPRTREARGRISPRVACRDRWRRAERLQANEMWLVEYQSCRKRFAAGERDVVFPHGTYQMRILHNVNVATC